MIKEFENAIQKARASFANGDDVGTVSWITRACGTVPQANASDEEYENVFQRLSDFVARGEGK